MAKKPLVDAVAVTEFGGIEDLAEFRDEAQHDYTYVPGFSDLRRQRDRELGEVVAGERKAANVSTLPVNLRWVRDTGSYGKTGSARMQGYQAVTKADLDAKPPWLTGMPPGATMGPDGTIRTAAGDLVLMKTTRERAAKNVIRKQRAALAMADAVGADKDGFVATSKGMKGVHPTITKS